MVDKKEKTIEVQKNEWGSINHFMKMSIESLSPESCHHAVRVALELVETRGLDDISKKQKDLGAGIGNK